MSRDAALARAAQFFDDGEFFDLLARRVAVPSTSQEPDKRPALYAYLQEEIQPALDAMGYATSLHENPDPAGGPLLVGERIEDPDLVTVLTYGHGDTVRGQEGRWRDGRDPWTLEKDGERWYGRGSADNKGQHSINLAALAIVHETAGQLGFNSKILIETSEETGSAGLREFCQAEKQRLKADVLVSSDGPRLTPDVPTLFMGTRGAINFELIVDLREGGHHSGNWGGIGYEQWLRNIAVGLGNAESSHEVLAALQARSNDPSLLVREHVQWALDRHQKNVKKAGGKNVYVESDTTSGSV